MQSNDSCKYCKHYGMDGVEHCFVNTDSDIFNFEGIEVEPVRHGKWNDNNDDCYPSACHCSVCGMDALTEAETDYDYVKSNYCPHCGAIMDSRMDGEAE